LSGATVAVVAALVSVVANLVTVGIVAGRVLARLDGIDGRVARIEKYFDTLLSRRS
jgi:phosphatidylserine synthase